MFLLINHTFWWAAGEMFLYLLLFAILVSAIVFLLRKPMRKYKWIDLLIFKKLQPWQNAYNNNLMQRITWLGKHNFLIPANLLLIFIFMSFERRYWFAFRILVMSLSSLLLMFLLKQLFHRKRPQTPLLFTAKGKSFPSGHAIMSVNFYGLLLFMTWHTGIDIYLKIVATAIFVPLILAIGFSRIYLKVHYASDVLAGFIIGTGWLYTSLFILNKLQSLMS